MWWLVAQAAWGADCPGDTRWMEESWWGLCVDPEGRAHGAGWIDVEGERHEIEFDHGEPVRVGVSGEAWRSVDLSTARTESWQVGEVRLQWPVPSRSGLRWYDQAGRLVLLEETWGWRERNLRQQLWQEDDIGEVVGARRWPSPRAHMRGHWTDGYYHRRTLGPWEVVLDDGSRESGQWRRGEPVGQWTLVAADGRVAEEGRYQQGYASGRWTCRDADGSELTGQYRQGLRVGDWVRLDVDGRQVEVLHYEPREGAVQLRGRGWRGGMLDGRELPSPCAPESNASTRSEGP